MRKADGSGIADMITPDDIISTMGSDITLCACVHKLVKKSGFTFIWLRTGRYVFQAVYRAKRCMGDFDALTEGCCVKAVGTAVQDKRAPYGFEIHLKAFEILSVPAAPYPLPVSDKTLDVSPEEKIQYRSTALRHPSERAVFKIEEGICAGFRSFMIAHGFTEIHTPKIVPSLCEKSRHAFRLDYFGENAYLAQSPQFYKQAAAAAFDRVFETGPRFRAEKHGSARHLNEFTGMDFELCYISDMTDVMQMTTAMLRSVMEYVGENYTAELNETGAVLPTVTDIPIITVYEALELLGKTHEQGDLDPTDEVRICDYVRRECGSEFVFITKFPSEKRPFYIMDSPDSPGLCESFDLLLRGMETASGGQRIHDYNALTEKLSRMGMDPSELGAYTDIHKYGIPPHGGIGIGLERLTMKLLGLKNIRGASMFPRDLHTLL